MRKISSAARLVGTFVSARDYGFGGLSISVRSGIRTGSGSFTKISLSVWRFFGFPA
jgi:hypothetical protein